MRLGIISTIGGGYTWAGSEEMWRLLAETALTSGHSVRVNLGASMAPAPELKKFKSLGGKVIARPNLNGVTRRMARRGMYFRFADFERNRDDVVLMSMGGIADCVWIPDLLKGILRMKTPLVVIVQANADGIVREESQRHVLRQVYQRAALVIFVSQNNQRLAERQLAWRFPNARILMNPLRIPMNQPLDWPDMDSDSLSLAEVARLEVVDKQQDQLLEALSTDNWKDRNWNLTFFGSGADENHIRQLINIYGLMDKARIGGHVADFRNIWKDYHLHILPSYREGMPLALIESMSCGRPALVTRAGGNAELVRDGVDGFVSPGMHPEIISETLERAWAARDRWKEMGRAAFARVSQLVPKDWAAQMLALIESVAAR